MTKSIAALLLSLFALSGCAPAWEPKVLSSTGTIAAPSDTPDYIIEVLVAAADAWGKSTNGRVALNVVIDDEPGQGVSRFAVEILPDGGLGSTVPSEDALPFIRLDTNRTRQPRRQQAVLMHEIGHALGLYDHEDGTLMRAFGVEDPVIDARTLERWEAL